MQDKTMKEQLLELVAGLENDDFNFDENFAMLRWSYEEKPFILFELMVSRVDQAELPLEEVLH